ncbi:MAG: LacI family transcriptional regulator [Propionibacteriaceae bacterium]|jgi:LacI family transcriptional regulator|nr:LacI family transcriptional regulator [Propionibacteriaceae bacterium]
MIRLSHVAKTANVSVSTASRALAGREHVSEETRQRVLRAANELGYEPNTLARGLRRNQTRMVGMLLPDTRGSSFSSEASQLLHRQLQDFGYGLLLCANHHDREVEKRYLQTLPSLGIAGLFHLPLASVNAEPLLSGGSPVWVIEFLRGSGSTKLDGVVHDEATGSVHVVEHLVGLGHRRLGLIVGPTRLGSTSQRLAGVMRALDFAGIDRDSVPVINAEHSWDGGGRAFAELMQRRPRPTAIYAAGAQLALGAAIAAQDAGILIPGQVSLVGLGNPSWGSLMQAKLTTYTLPIQEIAMTAALLMMSRLENHATTTPAPVQITISGRVNVRESTAPPGS